MSVDVTGMGSGQPVVRVCVGGWGSVGLGDGMEGGEATTVSSFPTPPCAPGACVAWCSYPENHCPVCLEQWTSADTNMVMCDDCGAWVHFECDNVQSSKERYSCPTCANTREADLGIVLNDAVLGVDCLQRSIERRWRASQFLSDGSFVTAHYAAMSPLLLQIMHVRGMGHVALCTAEWRDRSTAGPPPSPLPPPHRARHPVKPPTPFPGDVLRPRATSPSPTRFLWFLCTRDPYPSPLPPPPRFASG
jgi:hypothetical protein